MIDHEQCRRVFRIELLATPNLPVKERMCWENRPFNPPTPTSQDPRPLWLRESFLPGDDVLAGTNTLEGVSIYEIDVMTPSGAGTEDAEKLAQRIAKQIPAGKSLQSEDNSVQIGVTRSARGAGRDAGTFGTSQQIWYMVPVMITFRTYAFNQEA